MSLADELLADLEILGDAGDERDEAEWQNEDKMEVIDEVQENEAISDKSVKSITKLLDSKEVCVCVYILYRDETSEVLTVCQQLCLQPFRHDPICNRVKLKS